jgi:hypothetical protein
MNDLKICFNSFTEANEVHNDMLTLAQCGVNGAPLVRLRFFCALLAELILCSLIANRSFGGLITLCPSHCSRVILTRSLEWCRPIRSSCPLLPCIMITSRLTLKTRSFCISRVKPCNWRANPSPCTVQLFINNYQNAFCMQWQMPWYPNSEIHTTHNNTCQYVYLL